MGEHAKERTSTRSTDSDHSSTEAELPKSVGGAPRFDFRPLEGVTDPPMIIERPSESSPGHPRRRQQEDRQQESRPEHQGGEHEINHSGSVRVVFVARVRAHRV